MARTVIITLLESAKLSGLHVTKYFSFTEVLDSDGDFVTDWFSLILFLFMHFLSQLFFLLLLNLSCFTPSGCCSKSEIVMLGRAKSVTTVLLFSLGLAWPL